MSIYAVWGPPHSGKTTLAIDMAFCLDVSASMKFPSALTVERTDFSIYQINTSGYGWTNKNWLDTSRGYNNPYYLIGDASGTSTVFKVYYDANY